MFRYQFAARIVFIRYVGSGTTADDCQTSHALRLEASPKLSKFRQIFAVA